MGRECNYHTHFTSRAARDIDWLSNKPWLIYNKKNLTKHTRMDTEFELQWQKSKDKHWQECFEIDSMFRTSVHCFFSSIIQKLAKGRQKLLQVGGRFDLLRVGVSIRFKLSRVWISMRFELARLGVIRSQL